MTKTRTPQGCTVTRRWHNTETGQTVEEIELSCDMEIALEPRSVERVWQTPANMGDPWRYERKR